MTFKEVSDLLTEEIILLCMELDDLYRRHFDTAEVEKKIEALQIARDCVRTCDHMTGGDL